MANDKKTAKKKFTWTKKKIIALSLLAAGLVSLIIFGVFVVVFDIGPVMPIKSSEEDSRVVGKVGKYEVKYQEIKYLAVATSHELDEKYGEYKTLPADRKALYDEELRNTVCERVKDNYVVLAMCEKYGIDPYSRDVDKLVNDDIKALVDEIGSKKEYKKWLAENHLTDEVIRFVYRVNHLESLLVAELEETGKFEYLVPNPEFLDFVMDSDTFIKVIHAYYPKDMDFYKGFEDPIKSPKLRANEALLLLDAAGNDDSDRLSAMRTVIGTAPFVQGYSVTGYDYYITEGMMHETYDKAAFALDLYGYSEIIELEEGYYIIMRVPKDPDEIAALADNLVVNYKYATLYALEDEIGANMSFVGNELFNSLKLAEIVNNLESN